MILIDNDNEMIMIWIIDIIINNNIINNYY